MVSYSKPPVVEAVIEFRTDEAYDARDLERLRDRYKRVYPSIERVTEIDISLGEGQAVSHTLRNLGFKMTSANAVDVLVINSNSLVTSRLAPYSDFESLLAQTKENIELATKLLGRRNIVRIGVRFVNRIDVPEETFASAGKWPAFVNVRASLPAEIMRPEDGEYYCNLQVQYARTPDIKLIVQTGMMNPVLLNHRSYSLDIDASIENDIPQRFEDIWERVLTLRTVKNHVFEACITDAARTLFK